MSAFFEKKRNRLFFYLLTTLLLFVYALTKRAGIASFSKWLNNIISPVVLGLVFAYVVNFFLKKLELWIFKFWKHSKLKRVVCLVLSYAIVLAIIVALIIYVLPQLISNLYDFIRGFEIYLSGAIDYVNNFFSWVNSLINPSDPTSPLPYLEYNQILQSVTDYLTSLEIDIDTVLSVLSSDAVAYIMGLLGGTLSVLSNILFATFISIYLLFTKEKRYAQIMRFRKAFFSDKANQEITGACTAINKNFGLYFKAKVLDSLGLSVDLLIFYSITKTPYAFLTVFIIFLGNLIPIVGPIIATAIACVFNLIANPDGFILFFIFTVAIQILNSYIIAPLFFKTNSGFSFLFCLFAIVVCGSFFGVLGVVLAIPLSISVTQLLSKWLNHLLKKKGENTSDNEIKTMDVQPAYNAHPIPRPAKWLRHKFLVAKRKRKAKAREKAKQKQLAEQSATVENTQTK